MAKITMPDIKFGTDGWRGIIAEDFTYHNIKRVSQAIADYLGSGAKVAVGYDTRFMSRDFAYLISSVLGGNKIKTIVSDFPTPAPMLSYFVRYKRLNGGVMVTASHNPSIYNGVKFKEPYGCSSRPETTKGIEALIDKSLPKVSERLIRTEDISGPYLSSLKKYLIPKFMKTRSLRIVVDSMYGAGGFYLENILKSFGHKVITIHGDPNPIFPGINPEPIDVHLRELSKKVRDTGSSIGIATDGDADRVGIVDNNGNVLTPHYVFSLLLIHLKTTREWGGAVAKTISSTSLINRIAEKYNIPLKETPVGFKHIAELMLSGDILIGGEESGGNGFKNHIPERDGLLSGLLLIEMMGASNKKVSELVQEMEMEFGRYRYKRIDIPLTRALSRPPGVPVQSTGRGAPGRGRGEGALAGYKIVDIKTFDGTKFILQNGAWLLIRASGTEPILRIYAEAPTKRLVSDLVDTAKKLI